MAKYLRKVMHNRKYKAVIEALLEGGAVTRTPYQVRQRAFGYMLADRFRSDKHIRVPVRNPRLAARLEIFHHNQELERRQRMKPVHFALERQQFRLRVDGNLAREIIAGLPATSNPFDAQGILVADIEHGDFHVNVGKYGRLSNNITSMKREVRAALRQGGEPLKGVDIKCCQPALIAKTMQRAEREEEQARENESKETSIYDAPKALSCKQDLTLYCDLAQHGRLYEYLLEMLENRSCPISGRKELKKRFLTDVVAKRKANRKGEEYPSDVEDVFRAAFPSVYRFIRSINHDGWHHKNLIRQLQREESGLVIETVAADLVAKHPGVFVLPLHDALYTTSQGKPAVVAAFNSAFDLTNFHMELGCDD